jgi:hypothetical protein
MTTAFRTTSLVKLILGFMVFAFASSLEPAAAEDLGPPVGLIVVRIPQKMVFLLLWLT